MNTEIYIENYRLDVSKDISTLLNFAIDDVRDFSNRSTSYSKTIVLPGTANNNKLFGHIFNVGQSNDYDALLGNVGFNFNVSKSADCIIFQDQIQTFKGVLRLMEIDIIKGNVEYEVAVFGTMSGLNSALSGELLETLDFSEYDHTYSVANIIASWDNPGGSGYYYPLIDYGQYSSIKHDWDYRTFRPGFYVREYIDKMFLKAGFRYESDLFNTTRFKKIIAPHNQKELRYNASNIANGVRTTPYNAMTTLDTTESISVQTFTSSAFSADASKKIFSYTDTPTVTLSFTFLIVGEYYADIADIELFIVVNGIRVPSLDLILRPNGLSYQQFTWAGTALLVFSTTDYVEFKMFNTDHFGNTCSVNINSVLFNIDSATPIPVPANIGDFLPVNDTLPKNIKQIEFLTSIVKLFNLYVYEDRFDNRLIYFKPYVDFYSTDSADSVDWSYKINRDKAVKIKPMSEINSKKYEFRFKSDSDYYNELYRKRYSQGYGDYVFTSDFEFATQTNSFELIFSSTPLVGYVGEDKIYPTIFKQTNGIEEQVDSNIRIMQTKKITGVTSWGILDNGTMLASSTSYGYAGHFDDPDAPINDLNFGALKELFFTLISGALNVTQFNVYYSGYMAEITNKDSKLLTGNFYLTPKDIIELDFSKFIYLDGVLFRLNKIEDYNMTRPSDCKAELLKINYLIY